MEQRRIFVGGLIKEVTEEELHEKLSRFGTVGSIDIKTRHSETEHKTFAYVNLTADENGFKKCFTAYNNTKWKGGQLKLQFAKESFLDKLKQEQKEAKEAKTADHGCTHATRNPLLEGNNVKALPGTPVDEDGKWIMGKYSRVLPVLKVKNPTVKKLVTLDPSKMIHQLKKLKTDDDNDTANTRQDTSQLTWALEEKDSPSSKKRQGIFPEWRAPKKEKKDAASMANRLKQIAAEQHVLDTEMEVVPMGKTSQKSTARVLVNNGNGYNSDSSVGSADTDEILTKPTSKKKPSGSPVKKSGKSKQPGVIELNTSASKKKKEASQTKDSHPALSANSTPVNKCANGVSPDGKKKTKTPTAVKSVQEKAEKNDSVESDSKSKSKSGAKKPLQAEIDDSDESDSEPKSKSGAVHQQFKFVTPTAQGKCFRKAASLARTPPFRGLGMLSGASVDIGHDKQAEQPISPDTSLTQTGLKVVKQPSESPVSVDTKPSSKTPSLTLSTKSPTSAVEMKKHSETPRTRKESGGSETIHTPDSAKISSPKAARSKKKSRQAEEESDSDLDDNDLEKVCKKLAARSKPQDQSAGSEKRRRDEAGQSPSESSKKKKKNSDVVKGNESFNSMDTSHLNHKKNQEALVKQESLVTKMIREGAGSKRVKFSDDENESVTQEQETSNPELSERKLNLFDSDSDEEDGEIKIEIQPQFHGKKGMKLLELQSKFKDNRFKMDDRFQQTESEEEPEEEGVVSEEFTELSEEKKKSMEILEKVLGYKPRERRRPQIIDMNQIRYDPTKPSSMEITNTRSGDKMAVPKTENKTGQKNSVEQDVISKTDDKTKKQNGSGGDSGSASKDNVSDDNDNEASSNDESDADSDSEKEDSEEGSDSEKASSVNDSENASSNDNSNDSPDDSTSRNEDEEPERQQSESSSAVDEQEEENVSSDEDPTDDEDDDEDIKYSIGNQDLTEHLAAINEEEEEAETSSDDKEENIGSDEDLTDDEDVKYSIGKQNLTEHLAAINEEEEADTSSDDEEEEEESGDEDPTDDEDVKYSIGKQNLTEHLAAIKEKEEADTSSDDEEEEEEEASSDEDATDDDDEEVKYSIGKQNELASERQSDDDEEDEEDEEEASSDEDSADDEDIKYSIGKQNKSATERQADVVDDDVSDDSVDDDDANVSDDKDGKNEGDKAVKAAEDSAVSNPSLGNLFAGGDSFSFFDEPPAKKKKELQPQADVVKSTEKDSKVAVASAKRKLCSSPNFCLTKDSSRLQAGQQSLKSELDVKDYPELRREYQTLVRELHKKAVRKQKKHQLWQDKTNKRRNSKFKGAARRKKNKH